MRPVLLIFQRELAAYFRTPMGMVIAAATLAANGLLFNAWALGDVPKVSSEVLRQFFYVASGTTMISAIGLSMRLLAEEHQNGSSVLLFTAPVPDWQVVLGKFLSAFFFLALLTLATLYMPGLILVHGKVSTGHVVVGYTGLLLLGAATLAIGIFGSALARTQIVAAITSSLILVVLLLCWLLGRISDPPLDAFVTDLALWNKHFQPFMQGVISTQHVVYYVSVTFFFLFATTRVLEARRWR